MNQKKKLSILEFSRLTGISRDNLRFYDRIGLLLSLIHISEPTRP